jgi:hypothetical protein
VEQRNGWALALQWRTVRGAWDDEVNERHSIREGPELVRSAWSYFY